MIQFTKETWGDLNAALGGEWLETNGLRGSEIFDGDAQQKPCGCVA